MHRHLQFRGFGKRVLLLGQRMHFRNQGLPRRQLLQLRGLRNSYPDSDCNPDRAGLLHPWSVRVQSDIVHLFRHGLRNREV